MKFKGTAGMMVVFIGLGFYYFLVDLPAEKKKNLEKEIAGKVLPLKKEDVSELSISKKDQTITLQQNTIGIWNLSQPLKTKGDIPEVESFLTAIDSLEKSRVVESNAKNLSQYGLQSPSFKIRVKFKKGKEETLLLGNDSPMGGKIYLKLENDSAVLLAATSKADFDKPLYHFRDKTIFNFSSGSINRIQIKRSEHPLSLIREKEQWQVSGEAKTKADKDAVLAFLRALQFSRIKEFESESPESLDAYGLDKPDITVLLEDDNKNSFSIKIGASKNSSGYYAIKKDAPGVFLVDAKFRDTLEKRNADFLLKTLIEFEETNVAELNIQIENETIKAVRIQKDDWQIKKPKEVAADMATIKSLLFDLKEAKLIEFIKLSLDSADSFGLDKPKRSFSLTMADGTSKTIFLGNTTLDGKLFFAKRTGESTVFSVSQETTQKIFRTFHELRNKKLFKFKTDDVSKIIIENQKNLFELQKSGITWSLLKPDKMKIKEFLGKDLLWAMNGMEFESFIEEGMVPEEAGLTPPSFKISLWTGPSVKFAELQVGSLDKKDQQFYAQIEGQKGYYRIKKKYLDSFPLSLDKFKVQ
ncbi:MAG: DUF4340 domain-containing protein [Nitrospina sp.]|jgi:hypothetical protein|nr:DUF4340 domain-containing protein [Nitrospina sp.]